MPKISILFFFLLSLAQLAYTETFLNFNELAMLIKDKGNQSNQTISGDEDCQKGIRSIINREKSVIQQQRAIQTSSAENLKQAAQSQNNKQYRCEKQKYILQKKQKIKKNIRGHEQITQQQFVIKGDLYKTMGIPANIISIVLDQHRKTLQYIYKYFHTKQINSSILQQKMVHFKEVIERIKKSYLSDVKSVVLGSNNKIHGRHIWMSGSNMTVMSTEAFFVENQCQNAPVVGQDVVRIGCFDIELSQVQKIEANPGASIKYLGKVQ